MSARRKRLDRAVREQADRFSRACNEARQEEIRETKQVEENLQKFLGFGSTKQGERKKNRRWRKATVKLGANARQKELLRVYNRMQGANDGYGSGLGTGEDTASDDNTTTSGAC